MNPVEEPTPNPIKVRIGLAMISLVMVVAVVLFVVIDDVVARAIMFAVAVTCLVRVCLLVRRQRRSRA